MLFMLYSARSGERRSDGGTGSAVKPTSRPSERVRRDRYTPPSSHHVSAGSSQAEWKPPPTGDRSRSGHHDAKGNDSFHSVAGQWSRVYSMDNKYVSSAEPFSCERVILIHCFLKSCLPLWYYDGLSIRLLFFQNYIADT